VALELPANDGFLDIAVIGFYSNFDPVATRGDRNHLGYGSYHRSIRDDTKAFPRRSHHFPGVGEIAINPQRDLGAVEGMLKAKAKCRVLGNAGMQYEQETHNKYGSGGDPPLRGDARG